MNYKLKLPDKLVYMGYEFDISGGHTGKGDNGLKNWGSASFKDMTIKVHKGLHPSTAKVTLMHELIHIIGICSGAQFSEGQIDAIAYGMIEIINNNEWFMDYFIR